MGIRGSKPTGGAQPTSATALSSSPDAKDAVMRQATSCEEPRQHTAGSQATATADNALAACLCYLKLEQYLEHFVRSGYDDEEMLVHLDERDLQQIESFCSITFPPGHKKKLLLAAERARKALDGSQRQSASNHIKCPSGLAANRQASVIVNTMQPGSVRTPLCRGAGPDPLSARGTEASSSVAPPVLLSDPSPPGGGLDVQTQQGTSQPQMVPSPHVCPQVEASLMKQRYMESVSSVGTSGESLEDREATFSGYVTAESDTVLMGTSCQEEDSEASGTGTPVRQHAEGHREVPAVHSNSAISCQHSPAEDAAAGNAEKPERERAAVAGLPSEPEASMPSSVGCSCSDSWPTLSEVQRAAGTSRSRTRREELEASVALLIRSRQVRSSTGAGAERKSSVCSSPASDRSASVLSRMDQEITERLLRLKLGAGEGLAAADRGSREMREGSASPLGFTMVELNLKERVAQLRHAR